MRVVLTMMTAICLALPATAQAQTASPWGARAPATCTPLKQAAPPSAAQAAKLLRCAKENGSASSGELWLMEDLAVEVGGPTTYAAMYPLITMQGADVRKKTYPIRGSWTWSVCILRADAKIYGNPDLNCHETPVAAATGGCWMTTFADWKCAMNGTSGTTRRPLPPRRS